MASETLPEAFDGENLIKDSSILTQNLQKGCVCGVTNLQFANFLYRGCSRLYSRNSEQERRELLSFLSFLRSLLRLSIVLTSGNEDRNNVCKKLHAWLVLLRRLKFYILAGLHKIQSESDLHVSNLAQMVFNYYLTLVPCPYVNLDPETCCLKYCQRFSQFLVQLKGSNLGSAANSVKFSLHEIEQEISSVKKDVKMNCLTSKVYTESSTHCKMYNKHFCNF